MAYTVDACCTEVEMSCEFPLSQNLYYNLATKLFYDNNSDWFIQNTFYYRNGLRKRNEYAQKGIKKIKQNEEWQKKELIKKITNTECRKDENYVYFLNYNVKRCNEEMIHFKKHEDVPLNDTQTIAKLTLCKYVEFEKEGYDSKLLRINLGKRVCRMCASSQLLPIYYISFEYEFENVINLEKGFLKSEKLSLIHI